MKLNCNTCKQVVDRTYAFGVVKCFECKRASKLNYAKLKKNKMIEKQELKTNQDWLADLTKKYNTAVK